MKLLLDTHIIIWLFDGDKKLSKQAHDMITDTNNEIYPKIVILKLARIPPFGGG